ncbi:hypothetical protein CVT24_009194 [Panaeolus cyanescens]|uniref:Uncharacterized protein n=1 Tax=Panaeolus cyanescens TaxID=181874 RepID=A0A409Y8C5_9AGAR|nr:hypothetical protein CVT24_009194 [Panaeolus cyanescens]
MLLKLIPAPPAPTIHFSLSFADLPPTLPSPSTWTAQIAHLMLEDLRPPSTIHCLDRAVGIANLLEEVAFDIEHGLVRCRFVDGSIEEWPFDTNTATQPQGLWTLMRALDEISKDVKESTIEDEKFSREERERELAEREKERAERSLLSKTPSLSRKTSMRWSRERGHKKQRSFFMQFVSNCVGSIIHLTSPNSPNHPSGTSTVNTLTFQQTSFPTSPSPTSSSFPASPHSAPPVLQSHPSLPEVPNSGGSVASSTTSYPSSPFLISLPSPHKGQIPITPPLPGASPRARALRRSARSALVDAYRRFVLDELKSRFPIPTIARSLDANERGLPNAMGFGGEPEVMGNPNEAWHAESRTNSLANKKSAFMVWTLHSARWRAMYRMREILVETGAVRPDAQIDANGNYLPDAELEKLGNDAWAVDWTLLEVELLRDVTGTPMAVSIVDRRCLKKQAVMESHSTPRAEQQSIHLVSNSPAHLPMGCLVTQQFGSGEEPRARFSVDSQSGFEPTTMNVPESFSDDESNASESHHDGTVVTSPTETEDNQTLETATDGSSLHTPTSASHEHSTPIIVIPGSETLNDKDLPAIPDVAPVPPAKSETPMPSEPQPLRFAHVLPRLYLQEYSELHALRGRLAHLIAFSASQDRIMREELQNRFQVLAVRSRRRAWSGIGWSLGPQGAGKEKGHWKAGLDSCYGLAAPFRSSPLARYSWTASEASTVPFPSDASFESTSIETLEVGEEFSDESLKACGPPVSRQASASSTISEVSSIFSTETASVNTEATSVDIPLSDEMFILGDEKDEDEEDCQSLDDDDFEDGQEEGQLWDRTTPSPPPNVTETVEGPVSPTSPSRSRNALAMALSKVKAKTLPSLGGRPGGALIPGLAAVTEEPEIMEVDVHDVPEDLESWRISQRRERTRLMRQKRERRGLDEVESQNKPKLPVQRGKKEKTFMGCDEVAVEGDEEDADSYGETDLELGLRPSFTPYVRVRTGPSVPVTWTQDTLGRDSLLYQPLSSSVGTTPASSMPSTPILRTIDVAARPCTPPPLSPPLNPPRSDSLYYSRRSNEFDDRGSNFEYEMAGYGHFTSPHSHSTVQSELIKEFTLSIDLPQRQRIVTPSMSSGSNPKVNFAPLPSRAFAAPASNPADLQKVRRRRMDREKAETLEMIFAPGPGKEVADLCAVQTV